MEFRGSHEIRKDWQSCKGIVWGCFRWERSVCVQTNHFIVLCVTLAVLMASILQSKGRFWLAFPTCLLHNVVILRCHRLLCSRYCWPHQAHLAQDSHTPQRLCLTLCPLEVDKHSVHVWDAVWLSHYFNVLARFVPDHGQTHVLSRFPAPWSTISAFTRWLFPWKTDHWEKFLGNESFGSCCIFFFPDCVH